MRTYIQRGLGVRLKDMQLGQMGRVVGYDGATDRAYRHKLLRMGLVRGAEFTLVRKAPLGDPVEIAIGEFSLTLRRTEADALVVEPSERVQPRCHGRHHRRRGRSDD